MQLGWRGAVALVALLVGALPRAGATPSEPLASPVAASSAPVEQPIPEVQIFAPEPRYVAPTLRDRIGRIWAPVYLNGKGPYRLVLDTGASTSGHHRPSRHGTGPAANRCDTAARSDRVQDRGLCDREHLYGGRHGITRSDAAHRA